MTIITTEEVAKMLRIDKRTVQRQAKEEYYPKNVCTKVGTQYRFLKEELMKFLFSKEVILGE